MSKYHDDNSSASDPLPIALSEPKLRRLQPELYEGGSEAVIAWGKRRLGAAQVREMIAEHMRFGDTRAAVVVSEKPLVVAAYTDEQDAVLLLKFPQYLVAEHGLRAGAKLLTVNTYGRGSRVLEDIVEGPNSTGRYANFYPIVADFVSDSEALIKRRKQAISTAEWQRAAKLGMEAMARADRRVRDGRPLFSERPAGTTTNTGSKSTVRPSRSSGQPSDPLRDRILAIALAAPALSGAVMILLAYGSPGSAPSRNRATVIPVAILLLAFSAVGGAVYFLRQSRR
jgi:hypothetical protein